MYGSTMGVEGKVYLQRGFLQYVFLQYVFLQKCYFATGIFAITKNTRCKITLSNPIIFQHGVSCVVWHSSLTEKDSDKLERVQKVGLRIILKDGYVSYEKALQMTGLQTLKNRRELLCLNFARSALKSTLSQSMFPRNRSDYHAQTARNRETFLVQKARTDRRRTEISYSLYATTA